MKQAKNQNSETVNESECKKLLVAPQVSDVGSTSEPHDYVATISGDIDRIIMRCPVCEHLVDLVKLGTNSFLLERL